MADDPNWFREFYRFPGTEIVIYEARMPRPEIVLLAQHEIFTGPTAARAAWDPNLKRSVNIVAGEGEEYEDARGRDVPAAPKRPPRVDGLGADPPRRRIVGPKSTTVQAPDQYASPEEKAAFKRRLKEGKEAEEREAAEFLRRSKHEERRGVSVRGWRARALSPEKERELFGEDTPTLATFSALLRKIPTDQRTWLQSALVRRDDPFRWLHTSKENITFTPWVKADCIGWLVVEGAKFGLYFAARETPNSFEAKSLQKDVADYLAGRVSCTPKEARGLSIKQSSDALGIPKNAAITMSAADLFDGYQAALRRNDDKHVVHQAYHRVLLHRFLQRRALVPTARRSSQIGKEAERRANLLQAHRVFVFNTSGCPTRFNKRFLEANGIDLDALGKRNPTQMYERNAKNEYTVEQWTKWLYEDVLSKDPSDCRKLFATEAIEGLRALAGLGLLG